MMTLLEVLVLISVAAWVLVTLLATPCLRRIEKQQGATPSIGRTLGERVAAMVAMAIVYPLVGVITVVAAVLGIAIGAFVLLPLLWYFDILSRFGLS